MRRSLLVSGITVDEQPNLVFSFAKNRRITLLKHDKFIKCDTE